MARDFQIPGPTLIRVVGRSDQPVIGAIAELGVCDSPINVTLDYQYLEIRVDNWGNAPPECQYMLGAALVSMNLVHFDMAVLQACLMESMGGSATFGTLTRAGSRLGNGLPLYTPGGGGGGGQDTSCHFLGLYISSPVQNLPWYFPACYMMSPPASFPQGIERQVVPVNFKAIPYDNLNNLYNNGLGSQGVTLWARTGPNP